MASTIPSCRDLKESALAANSMRARSKVVADVTSCASIALQSMLDRVWRIWSGAEEWAYPGIRSAYEITAHSPSSFPRISAYNIREYRHGKSPDSSTKARCSSRAAFWKGNRGLRGGMFLGNPGGVSTCQGCHRHHRRILGWLGQDRDL